ncbi:Fe3+-siderophore ABC transporter permease [Arsenicibacter rosenii]|uniref:Fe3+-siderophore ABC transporter permease n=1 Tax=Arsenicibacter rosenii TaxID=1750698 RepID=A0A1S2VP63_9BACT|nr:Fe3+-siderophore ABC transporter permease [Arsenicibacter rosenii]
MLGGLAAGLVVTILCSVGVGALPIPVSGVVAILMKQLGIATGAVDAQQETILLVIRLPRILLGVLVGAVLSMAGASIQGLFRNPLADPGLIGISSGASLMAVVMIVLQINLFTGLSALSGLYALSLAAFTGATGATLLVYFLSRQGGRTVVSTMLLVGIAVNVLCEACRGLLVYLADDTQLRAISFWSLGSLGGATREILSVAGPFLLIPLLLLPRLGRSLNAFTLGESQAGHLGVHVGRLKGSVILLTTLGVGVAVSVSGMIGFVGLVVPHLIRQMAGADNRLVLPASGLLGAIILTLADLLARTLVAPAELPIGIITGMAGAPVFLSILLKNRSQSHA